MAKRKSTSHLRTSSNPVQSTKGCNKTAELKSSDDTVPLFEHLFGFSPAQLKRWNSFVTLLHSPRDPSSLGVVRALFGMLMVLDIPDERGLADIDIRWGDPEECRFPLFNFLHPLSLEWMCVIYLIMWIGAFGIMLGFFFKLSCLAFIVPYWYIFLLDKSTWNNHTYLYGLVAILLLGTNANYYWSLDVVFGRVKQNKTVPLWNYTILRIQFFILYFFAGLKKMDRDWIEGYSMTNLSQHWIFDPFKMLLSPEQVDYWIVHVSGFLLDLTIGFWLFFDKTRPYAIFFCSSFHFMNSRLFSIGVFPYVCLATMPIFCYPNWPKSLACSVKIFLKDRKSFKLENKSKKIKSCSSENNPPPITDGIRSLTWKEHLVAILLISHTGLQVFLPYSHFITLGYNNWTNGLYGYSWDMMVHSWDTILVVVRVVDNISGKEHFLDPEAWVQTDRWAKHADMMVQYANCLKYNLLKQRKTHSKDSEIDKYITGDNISIYFDVWCSLNGRFQQRMFDPHVDILQVDWSPFRKPSWLMPLLTEFSPWRQKISKLEKEVYSWSNYSDALFVADFPGLLLENFITEDLSNVSLTVLEGVVTIDIVEDGETLVENQTLSQGQTIPIPIGVFHKVHVVSPTPACYMYTYVNRTKQIVEDVEGHNKQPEDIDTSDGNFISDLKTRIDDFIKAWYIIFNAIFSLTSSVPMMRRIRIA